MGSDRCLLAHHPQNLAIAGEEDRASVDDQPGPTTGLLRPGTIEQYPLPARNVGLDDVPRSGYERSSRPWPWVDPEKLAGNGQKVQHDELRTPDILEYPAGFRRLRDALRVRGEVIIVGDVPMVCVH